MTNGTKIYRIFVRVGVELSEKKVRQGDRNFVELARSRYRGVISSVRHQFQLMKPENLTKIRTVNLTAKIMI
ncbi:MAG: hypothetical protein WKF71_01890 [Pyrinomonadaceae bacterium]